MEDFNIKAEWGTFQRQQVNLIFAKYAINFLNIQNQKWYLNIDCIILENFKKYLPGTSQ